MENIQTEWTDEKPGRLYLEWDTIPFNFKSTVLWRDEIIHIKVAVYKIEHGHTRIITFVYKKEIYNVALTKWKYLGGGNGVYPPEIRNSKYRLKIASSLGSLELIDEELIEPAFIPLVEKGELRSVRTPDFVHFNKQVRRRIQISTYVLAEFKRTIYERSFILN